MTDAGETPPAIEIDGRQTDAAGLHASLVRAFVAFLNARDRATLDDLVGRREEQSTA